MTKFYTNNFMVINLHKKPSTKSEVVTQMIYGDSFSIQNKTKKWLKIKIKEDNYKGYIKKKKYSNFIRPTHKISVLKSKIFKFPNRIKLNEISFGCKIKIINNSLSSYKFSKGWINKKDVKPISYKDRDIFKNIKDFKNIKYKWGGKSFKGIDCSALVQVFLNFNNKFCPRDAKDQVRYFNKNIKLKDIKKNDIIYWKGHVAIALSNKKLIHAYGPMKKTIIMGIDQTIKRIEKTAGLKVIAIKRLK